MYDTSTIRTRKTSVFKLGSRLSKKPAFVRCFNLIKRNFIGFLVCCRKRVVVAIGMSIESVFSSTLLIIVMIFTATSTAYQEYQVQYTDEDFWKKETPLQCYDCNSEYDPRCGDPFNPYTIGVVNCSEQRPPEHLIDINAPPLSRLKPTVCRKIVQKIEGKKRVIRECGYIQDKRDDKQCFRRTGTQAIETIYCSCTKSLCNDGSLTCPAVNYFVLTVWMALVVALLMP